MSEPQSVPRCRCGRHVEASGVVQSVEDAIAPDKQERAYQFLRSLQSDHGSSRARERRQQRYADLIDRLDVFSSTGKLQPKRQLRHILGEIWEIKTAEDRLLFYNSDHTCRSSRIVRLTNGFAKAFGKTAEGKIPQRHIRAAEWVRDHDMKLESK